MRTITYRTIFIFGLSFALLQPAFAKVVSCNAFKGNAKGWIPRSFVIDLAEDRTKATVIEPKSQVFGAVPFEKGLFGSDLWSRGKGRSNEGEFYNYHFQLVFKEDDTKARIELSMQGYNPLTLYFRCSTGISSESTKTYQPSTRKTNTQRAKEASNENLCIFATREENGQKIWDTDRGVDEYVDEAKNRGLSCGVVSNAVSGGSNAKADSLKQRLLEAKKLYDSKLISEDEYKSLKKKLLGL